MVEGRIVKVKYIVVDLVVFLKNVLFYEMCDNVYMVEDVINEIRDVVIRQCLLVLFYSIYLRELIIEVLYVGKVVLLDI